MVRLHVHAKGVDFLTCCEEGTTILELRKTVERQYTSLNPRLPPLATHSLRDSNEYLLPDSLLVGEALAENDHVYAVCEKGLPPAGEVDLAQALSRWHYFQKYTLLAISLSVKRRVCENVKGRSGSIGVEHGAVLVLVESLASSEQGIVQEAAVLLEKVLCAPNGSPVNLGNCQKTSSAGFQCAKWICALALYTKDDLTARCCAAVISSCLKSKLTKDAMVKSGAGAALVRLSRSEDQGIRSIATAGLMQMLNSERKESVGLAGSTRGFKLPQIGSPTGRSPNAPDDQFEMLLSVEDAIATLETSDMIHIQRLALETVLRECGSEAIHTLALHEGARLVRAFRRVSRTGNSMVANLVGDILVHLSMKEDESDIVFCNGGFELLVMLIEEEEDAYRTFNYGTESKRNEPSLASRLTAICTNDLHMCPLKLLVDTLVQSASFKVREIVTESILWRSKMDDANELSTFIGPILSAASQSPHDGSKESLFLVQTLSFLSVKEVNKIRLIKYGAVSFFTQTLISDDRIEAQRAASKALANLASSTPENRAVVIDTLQTTVKSIDHFQDSIVNMYIEMIFTAD